MRGRVRLAGMGLQAYELVLLRRLRETGQVVTNGPTWWCPTGTMIRPGTQVVLDDDG